MVDGCKKITSFFTSRLSEILFCGVKYLTLVPYKTQDQNLNHLQKHYLECIKTGRNDSKFTIGKYHINTMEIIKLFRTVQKIKFSITVSCGFGHIYWRKNP